MKTEQYYSYNIIDQEGNIYDEIYVVATSKWSATYQAKKSLIKYSNCKAVFAGILTREDLCLDD